MATSTHVPTCPACRDSRTRCRGRIPDAVEFAGTQLDHALEGGSLWVCAKCRLQFRHPHLSRDELNGLYRAGNVEAWNTATEGRIDWDLARQQLDTIRSTRPSVPRILDVGCWDGRFLASIEGSWELNGIEINPIAADLAAQRGVSLVGHDLAHLDVNLPLFDVVTAFDVIEHVADPAAFLQSCARLLKPNGTLIIATGDTASLPWKLLGPRHLYCIWPEHLCFISEEWCTSVEELTGLRVCKLRSYRRTEGNVLQIAADTVKSLVYAVWPALFTWLRSVGLGNTTHKAKFEYPPLWPTAKDHFLVCFAKVRP